MPVHLPWLLCWFWNAFRFGWMKPYRPFRRRGRPARPAHRPIEDGHPLPRRASNRAKPAWVVDEVIRLAATRPALSLRELANEFNRRHGLALAAETVGRTFVSTTLERHAHRVEALRKEWKRRPARRFWRNAVWAVDITFLPTTPGASRPCVGLLDHGSRALLSLQAVKDKTAVTLLRVLLDAIERHGKPHAIRTDNEGNFTSHLFRLALRCLGIRHQRIRPHAPWQNGRIERFFGTLKRAWDGIVIDDLAELNLALESFGRWYNHGRPHTALGGLTPAVAWRRLPLARGTRPLRE